LPGARLVNPFNVNEVAEALREALEGPPNHDGFRHMFRFVQENTSVAWSNAFLERLERCTTEQRSPAQPLRFNQPELALKLREAERPLVLLDYDGTLRSFVVDPNAAIPDRRIVNVLSELGRLAATYVISGRSAATLDAWLGQLDIGLVSEHGLALKPHGGSWEYRVEVDLEGIKRLVEPLFKEFTRRTPGTRCEYKQASLAWHYRGADPEYGLFQAHELFALLSDSLKRRPYQVLRGNRVIEVRHQGVTKGQALSALLKRHPKADFLFCAGDDRTDEEMFAAVPAAWRKRSILCWVGNRNPHATHWVQTNTALLEQLELMIEVWSRAREAQGRRMPTGRPGPGPAAQGKP
jgi:trehalose 6-phosphate synthase/phosphatase